MKYLISLILPLTFFAQTNLVSSSSYETNFQLVQREITSLHNLKTTTFTGNKYFYKKPRKAKLELIDRKETIIVMTNYNLLDKSFDIKSNKKILKLLPNKIKRVVFDDRVFVSKNGKFYQSIEENRYFSLLTDTFLESYIPDYQPEIQEKPDPRFRRNKSTFLYYKNRFTYIERRKSFLLSMFEKSKVKEINNFYKKSNISPKNDNELKNLFIEFIEFLKL